MYFQVMVECIPESVICDQMVVVPYDYNDYEVLVRSPTHFFYALLFNFYPFF